MHAQRMWRTRNGGILRATQEKIARGERKTQHGALVPGREQVAGKKTEQDCLRANGAPHSPLEHACAAARGQRPLPDSGSANKRKPYTRGERRGKERYGRALNAGPAPDRGVKAAREDKLVVAGENHRTHRPRVAAQCVHQLPGLSAGIEVET